MTAEAKVLPPPKNRVNPGHFGRAIIGDEEFEREQAWKKTGGQTFGTAVLGGDETRQKPTEAQLKAQPGLAALHGLPEPGAKPAAKDGTPQFSVRRLEEMLEEGGTALLDDMLAAERERPGGPRRAAIELFLKVEQGKPEFDADFPDRLSRRPEVIAELKGLLEARKAVSSAATE